MSNQTYLKSDRISFARNLAETYIIANNSNSIAFGPIGITTLNLDGTINTINSTNAVVFSNQYIYGDGSYLTNIPTTSGVSQSNLNSTLNGLGILGYISSSQLTSTVNGIGIGGISQSQLTSTTNGLANIGYISSSQLVSSVTGMNAYISSFIDPTELTSTVVGLATEGYLSTAVSQPNLTSSITGLGTVGYISSTQLTSTVTGLGAIYLSSALTQTNITSSITGLGTVGYISSSQLVSTTTGLGAIYLSSALTQTNITSSITGLGTVGYISSSQLTSTVSGLGSGGSAANWATYPASQYVNMNCNDICNINSIFLSNPDAGDFTQLYFAPGANKELYYYDCNFGGSGAVAGSWWQYGAAGQVDLVNNNIININTLNLYNSGTGDSIDLTANNIYNNSINSSETALIVNNALQINNTLNINAVGHNPMIQFQNGADYFTIQAQIDNIGGVNTKAFGFTANINMNSNIISNIQVNYSNTFSNTSVAASLLSASPQTFSGAIYDQYIPTILFSNTTTGSESNYLYFTKNQSMWKIHITMNGVFSTSDTTISFYFTLSNSTSAIETPLSIYTSNSPFRLYLPGHVNNLSLSLNDSVNLNDIINSSILPYTPISLNMYCSENANNFTSSNIGNWTNPINLSALTIGYGVAYGNNTWMVVGYESTNDCGYLATSYDNARTWVGTSLPITSTAYCVAYGNGIWVIGCDGGNGFPILYSTDGTNFNESSADLYRTRGVAYGNGVFVATGDANDVNVIIYSTDGKTWYAASERPNGGGLGVTYANGIFVVVGDDGGGGLFTSQDGIHWQQYNVPSHLKCVAYGAGRWYASDEGYYDGTIYYSTDNWNSYTEIYVGYYLGSLAFGDTFVGIDINAGIYSSPDFGSNWNTVSESFNNAGHGIAYGNGVYVACGDNGDSNCISIAYATNSITYSLEPATIQPQSNVLAAPVIDWNQTYYEDGSLIISWFTVPGATSYKIFLHIAYAGVGGVHYVNKYTEKATNVLNNSLSANMFNSDSGPLFGNSYAVPASTGDKNNYFVFAYKNGVRSSFPSTQILDWNGLLELWPVEECEFHGGTDRKNFTSVTARNLYTNQCMVVLSNDWMDGTYGSTQLPQLGLDVYLSNH